MEMIGTWWFYTDGRVPENVYRKKSRVGFFFTDWFCTDLFPGKTVGGKGYFAFLTALICNAPDSVALKGQTLNLYYLVFSGHVGM
jgi:hypothetical protein